MQKELNEDFIEKYSEQFATKISENFYASHSHISGKEILTVSPSKQVNFFIIKLLFNNWQQEFQRLESPFFNYDTIEVKEALLQFMNVLSQSIQIEKKEFDVLLREATKDTLFLIMVPNDYMRMAFDRKGAETLNDKVAKHILKYINIAKPDFTRYFQSNIGMDKEDLEIDESIISATLLEEEIAKFSQVIPLTIKQLWEGDQENAVIDQVQEEAPDSKEKAERDSEAALFLKEEDTLNDKFENPVTVPTIAESHEGQTDTMMAAISVNYRYMFINELFNGEVDLFTEAISKVEACSSFDESVEILVQNYAKKHHWDMNSDEVKELLKIIFRRFR